MVDFDETRIIAVDDFSQEAFARVRNETDKYLCNCNLDVIASEIKPTKGTNEQHPVSFIELFNKGAALNICDNELMLNGLYLGDILMNNIQHYSNNIVNCTWLPETYLVVFDDRVITNGLDPWCFNCSCTVDSINTQWCYESIYHGCDGMISSIYDNNDTCASMDHDSVFDWELSLSHNKYGELWNLKYNITGGEWNEITYGYTYELTPLTCWNNKQSGTCWQESCTYYGTPGWSPLKNCDCSLVGDVVKCQQNGDVNAQLINNKCSCTDNYYPSPSGCECLFVPIPTFCHIIINTNDDIVDAEFNIDPIVLLEPIYEVYYEMLYTYQDRTPQLLYTAVQKGEIDNARWKEYDFIVTVLIGIIDLDTNQRISIHRSIPTICTEITPVPTISPTMSPTRTLPPIESCNATIISQANDTSTLVRIEWTKANTSIESSYTNDEFDDNYLLFREYTNSDQIPEDQIDTNGRDDERNKVFAFTGITPINIIDIVTITISARVHELNNPNNDLTDELRDLMYKQSTLCQYMTLTPTVSPTREPTNNPSYIPSNSPSYTPTMTPTYSRYNIEYCNILITNDDSDLWNLTWNIIEPNMYSSNIYSIVAYKDRNDTLRSNIIPLFTLGNAGNIDQPIERYAEIDIQKTRIELYIRQPLTPETSNTFVELPETRTLCDIYTLSPTISPSIGPPPTMVTNNPSNTPTPAPTNQPTPTPTYNIKIEYCEIILLRNNKFDVSFSIPKYDGTISTPIRDNVRYKIEYNGFTTTVWVDHFEYTNGTMYTEQRTGVGDIDISTRFKMSIIDTTQWSTTYSYEDTNCIVKTLAPSISPTLKPTISPAIIPTYADPGVYIRTSDTQLCQRLERCECNDNIMDYTCNGSPTFNALQGSINFNYNEQQTDVITFVKLPTGYPKWVQLYWKLTPIIPGISNDDIINFDNNNNNGNNILNDVMSEYVSPYSGYINIQDDARTLSIAFREPEFDINTMYLLTVINCTIEGNINDLCDVIYPSQVILQVSPEASQQNLLIKGVDDPPDWIWILLTSGITIFTCFSYLFYVSKKNKMMQQESAHQNINNVALIDGQGINELNNDTMFINPMAT